MKTRILAMLLCAAILLSSLPMSVFAEEWKGSKESELEDEAFGEKSEGKGDSKSGDDEDSNPSESATVTEPTNNASGLDLIGEVITTGDNFRIRMNSDGVSYAILEYFGTARKVEVIKEYYGLPITKIGDSAFRNHSELEEVTLPDTLVYVGESVFDGCTALKYNTVGGGNYIPSYENEYFYFAGAIDKSVETFTVVDGTVIVGAMSLYHYENLKSFIFPTSVIQMGYAAIGWCDKLESVTLPFVGMDGKGTVNGQFGWAFGARTFGGNISYVPESLKTVAIQGGEAIAKGAFYGVDQIETLIVPFLGSGIDNEENAYFSYFWNGASSSDNIVPQSLKNVTISGGKLGYGAFYQCTRIETISLLNNVTSIGYSAFSDCSSLMDITIPNSVTIIGQYAFNNCTSLIDVTIPNGVTSIGGAAFSGCTALLNVTLGDNINSIGDYAFNNCISLMSIIIPNGVTNFGRYTFQNCSSLTSVSIGNSVTSIGQYTFQNCTSLTNITIADSVTTIGQYAFQGCTSLTSISLSNHLNSIEEYAFQNCKCLKSIAIPDSVTNIEQNAFQNCTSLKSVHTPNLAKWCAISFGNYTANPLYYAEKLYIDETLVTSLVIPDGITSVGNYAFYNCKGLTSVIIKNSVTSIGEYTFYGCSGLTNISIPNSVLSIGQYAFRGCSGLTSVTLGSNITSIGPHIFQNCTSLTSVTIPNSVDSIGEYAFYGCYRLASVTIGNAAASIGQYAFQDCTSLTGIIIPNSVESIGNYAFSGCSKLESVTIGNSVISIGQYAFQKCSVLNSIIIPNSVESIGKYAFSGCSALMTVTIGNNVTSIGEYAFQNCVSLYRVINNSNLVLTIASSDNGYVAYYAKILVEKDGGVAYKDDGYEYIVTTDEYLFQKKDGDYELIAYFGKNETVTLPLTIEGNSYSILRMRGVKNVIIPNGFTSIGDNAFSGCKSLVSITIPTSVTRIGASAFYGCVSLTSISIPSSVTAMGSYAFAGCTGLTAVTVPNVKILADYAFKDCTGLKSIVIPDTVRSIYSSFSGCTGLTSVTIPDSVKTIGDKAFSGCSGLIFVILGNSVSSIHNDAFEDCIKLVEVINKSSLNITVGSTENGYIGYYAKNVCATESARKTHTDSNGYITYSDGSLVSLLGYAGTSNELVLPTGITEIYQYAFNNHNTLTSITLPATLASVGQYAFVDCHKLKSIYYMGNVAEWCSISGIGNLYWVTTNRVSYGDTGYSLASRTLYIQNKKVEGSLTIPNSVTSIGDYAFYNCDGLTSISIPDTITSIGSYAFKNCGLTSVIIPNSVTTIGNYAFQSCSDLLSVTIGNKVMSMGSSIFSGCNSLTSITIPDSVTSIGDYSFEYCRNLTSITIGSGVKTIGKYAFQECDGLASLTIPASLTSIGSLAFMGCDNLHTFYYEGDIAGWCAVSGISAIHNVGGLFSQKTTVYISNKLIEGDLFIPDSITSIGDSAFYGCSELISVTIPESVTNIGDAAFYGCSGLISVTIPDRVTSIGNSLFYGCSGLISVAIPDGVTNIGNSAFINCSGLVSVTMTDSVTRIGSSAFANCTNLTHVVLSNNLNTIYENAFSGCSALDEESDQVIKKAIKEHGYEDTCLVAGTLITLADGSQKKIEDVVAGDILLTWDFSTGTYSFAPVVFNDAETVDDYMVIYVTFSDGTTIGIATEHGFFDVDLGKYVYLDLDAAQYIGHAFINQQGKKVVLENVEIKPERVAVYSPVTYQVLCYYANGMLSVPGGISGLLNPFAVDADTMQYDQAKMQEDIATYGLLDYEEASGIIPEVLFESFNGQYLKILIGKGYISWETIYGLMERYLPLCEETTNSSKSSESVLFLSPKRGFTKAPTNEDIDSLQFISNGNGTCFVASIGTYKDTAVIIPATSPMGESVTSIGDYAFSGCTTLTSITIPDGVTSIGMNAFAGCIALTSITVPNSVTSIGTNAFFGCVSLQYNQYSTIGNFTSTKYLGNATNPYLVLIQATASYISGTNYTISSGTKVIYDSAFSSYTNLTSITIPDSVTGIGANVFSNCSVLESITVVAGNHVYHSIGNCIIETASKTLIAGCKESIIPDDGNVKIIGEGAFAGCSQLTSITIPISVTTIKSNAFANCTSLTSITYLGERNEWRHVVKASNWDENTGDYGAVQFEKNSGLMMESNENVTEFWVSGFRKNNEITGNVSIDISSGYSGRPVTKIYAKAFNGQSGVASIALPDTITAIGEYAFADCLDLESINLPSSLSSIGFSIFSGCRSLSNLTIPFLGASRMDAETAYFGYLFGAYSALENGNYISASLKNISIIYAETIPAYAFYGCSSLESIALPGDLTYIGNYAFANCSALHAFTIPDGVESVGEMILSGCYQVKTITIGASLNEIGDRDDDNYQIKDQSLFGLNKALSTLSKYEVAVENRTYATDSYGILYRKMIIPYTNGVAEIKVSVVDAPARASITGYRLPGGNIVRIEPYAFAYNSSLLTIELENVRMISSHAFYEADNLVSVHFGETKEIRSPYWDDIIEIAYNQYVGNYAFMGCSALQKVNIETDMLIGIGAQAFYDCGKLNTVILGKNIQVIGSLAFGKSYSGEASLEQFQVADDNEYFTAIDGVLYAINEDETLTLIWYPALLVQFDEDHQVLAQDGKPVYATKFVLPDQVSSIDLYAFSTARMLEDVELEPDCVVTVQDYAFSGSSIQAIRIGENIVSLGTKRGEGEYTVFADCNYLTDISVSSANAYYSSIDGVLFDKEQTKLIRYPEAKVGSSYLVPGSVSSIASMAFKHSQSLQTVTISSYVSSIGLEAFYLCTGLAVIFFDGVYAPRAVMENAFTTFFNSNTTIGYSQTNYVNGQGADDFGWVNYEGSYSLQPMTEIPSLKVSENNGYYAIVIVDKDGNRVEPIKTEDGKSNFIVSLTDPNGVNETVYAGMDESGLGNGVAVFYDLYGEISLGFAINFEQPYSLRIYDTSGTYMTFVSNGFYLDQEMRITYITLVKGPSIYGLNCGEADINTQSTVLNKAVYGTVYDTITLKDESRGYNEDNIILSGAHSETVDISVIGYYDLSTSFVGCNLLQNGIEIPGCEMARIEKQYKIDEKTGKETEEELGTILVYFSIPADSLIAEVPIEAKITVEDQNGIKMYNKTFLNINVIDFTVNDEDVNLDTKDLSVDLSKSGDIIGKLLGSKSWNFNLGDNVSVGVDIDGDTATLSLNAAYSASKDNTKEQEKKYTTNCEEGYYANLLPHNKGTWFFQKKIVMWENDGIIPHVYTMNIRFVSGTGAFGHYYYRCYIYEGDYKNQKALFYGAISSSNNMGRKICAIKANVIYATYAAKAIEAQDITKGFKYSEPIMPKMKLLQDDKVVSRVSSTKQDFSATLYGDIVFQYQAGKGLVPVSSYILGEIRYELLHKEQFVVWVIPIYLEVSVKLDGKIELSLKYDAWRSVSIDEAKMTLSAEITAKVGVGCELISVGVYGTIGTVFILDFAPTFGVEKWTVSGKLALYATFYTLTWKKWGWVWYPTVEQTTKEHTLFEKTWTIIDNSGKTKFRSASTRMLPEMFLAKNYIVDTSENAVAEEARLIQIGNTLYKIYAANRFTESENPEDDDYNYRKIALAKWNETSEEWEFCQFLDDNQFNDLAFDLYQTEDGVAVVFTQQTQMVEEGDDSYSYVSNLCVKYAWIDEDGTVTVSELATSGNYKYLSTVSFVDGVPTVVWVENADNNIFGVSPYNYVDATGVSHIYETTANSVWMSQLIDGVWTEATCIQSGLSAVTDLAVTENGYVVYIVDENGDLADISDREAYYKGIESRKIRMLAGDDVTIVTSVVAFGNGVIYYCQNNEGETLQFTDLVSNAKLDLPEDASYLTDDYKVIYDETGVPAAILYSDALSWKEDDTDCYGSTLYGIFRTETGWGNPVEITTDLLSPSDNRYVSSFDAMFNEEGLLLFVEYSDRDGNCKAILMDTFTLGSKVSLIEQKVDYVQSLLTVTFENKGTEADGVYAMINGVSRMNVFDLLSSGEKQTETLDLSAYGRNLTVTFYNTSDNSLIDTIELDLNHSDLQPIIKQLLLGKNNTLLVAVRNNGNLASDGTLYVVIGNENAETILTNEKTYADSFSAVAQNELIYKEIALSDDLQVDENTIVTIYVVASGNLEKGNCTENNLIYGTLKQFSSAVADDGSSYCPTIDVYQYQFDSQNPKDVSIRYSCSENDSIVEILLDGETVSAGSYDLEDQRITFKKEYLATLMSGKEAHTLSLTFATGDTISVELQIPAYYTITWTNEDGTLLDTTLVKAGQIPDTEVIPIKAEDEYGTYTFTGWMNGVENIKAADADTTYTAVYLNTAPIYSVTWVMMTDEGEFSVEELYEYGKSYDEEISASNYVPEYKGTMWAPYGKQFSSWDKVVEPVTEDVVYTATYTKSKQGTATVTNSTITAVAGKTFTTTVSLEDVHDMTGTTLTISYDATLVTLDHVVTGSKVSVIEMSEGQLILSVTGLSNGATFALADLTFRVSNDLEEGEYDILGVASAEDLTDEMSNMIVAPESDAELILENRIATTGRTVQVTLFLQNNPGFAYLNVSLDYDHDNLMLIDVKNEASALAFVRGTDVMAWDNTEDYLANGKLCTLTFEVSEDASLGEYSIGLIVNECYNEKTDSVNLFAVGGTVNVIDFVYGDVNGDGTVDGKDLIVLRRYLVGADVEIRTGTDVNGDGDVDGKDVIILRKYLVGTAQLGPTA